MRQYQRAHFLTAQVLHSNVPLFFFKFDEYSKFFFDSPRTIPLMLFLCAACLRKSGDKKNQWSFYGHLTAYLACLYGHRGAVFQNMTIKEVEEAQQTAREGTYVITVSGFISLSLCTVFS